MFCIITVGGPAEKYIDRCLSSVVNQTDKDWRCVVVLDPVGDKTGELAKKYESDRLQVKLNEERRYALPNILTAVKLLNPAEEDILVTLDADDWLNTYEALAIVRRCYAEGPVVLTHGSWEGYPDPNAVNNSAPYYEAEFNAGIRGAVWKGTHLRTFKYKLWRHVWFEDLKDADGNYFQTAWDLAFMWPMMEMAGYRRIRYIPEKLYVYNRETPHNDEKLRSAEQQRNHQYLIMKPRYPYLENL